MKRVEKYELMYTKFSWFFIIASIHVIVIELMYTQSPTDAYFSPAFRLVLLLVAAVINFVKYLIVKRNLFSDRKSYYILRIFEMLVINFFIVVFGLGEWAYIVHIFLILITCVGVGRKPALILTAYAYATNAVIAILFYTISNGRDLLFGYLLSHSFLDITLAFATMMLFALLCGKIYDAIDANEIQNTRLFAELANKYDQLT
ncbi:MAG: hypothetical protein GX660_14215, partial [Clostridiaceae bacterium]|nr:hypothetical protein [Clostridiaceae bacterium]